MKTSTALAVLALLPCLSSGADPSKTESRSSQSSSSASASGSASGSSSGSTSISSEQKDGKATVKLDGKEVWSGEVKHPLIAVSKSVNGKNLAAAFDGRKLLWENVPGAGAQLEPERKEAARRLKN